MSIFLSVSPASLPTFRQGGDAVSSSYYRARYYDPQAGRFLKEDPIGFFGGPNFYEYAGNSPLDHYDPAGLWSPGAHRQIIWNALHSCGVSNSDIYQIQQGSQWVDDNFQGPQYSYMHSMSNGITPQSPQDATNQKNNFIRSQMTFSSNAWDAGSRGQAMFLLGTALHPVMDGTSPAHTEQGNPIPWCGMGGCGSWGSGLGQVAKHSPNDLLGNERIADLTANPKIQQSLNPIIRSWYESLTGQKLNCGCN